MNNPTPAPSGHTPPTVNDEHYVELVLAAHRAEAVYRANPTQENFDAWHYAEAHRTAALIQRQDAARAAARGQS